MEVSIVITCFNQEKYISRAVRSCLNQDFPKGEYEVIVVDDGSTDHSPEIISDFGERIVFIQHKKNEGLSAARNNGIRKATGRYVVNVDGDDFILKELARIGHLHLNLNAHWGAVSCDYVLVDNQGIHLSRISGIHQPIACGIMYRKDYLIAIGLYDEKMRAREDQDLRERFMKSYYIGHVELPLYRYRRHEGNLTNDVDKMRHYDKILRKKIAKSKKNGT